jgi:hypothetical protein
VKRFFLWALVAAYTAALPYANIVYEAISIRLSPVVIGKIPITVISLFGVVYVVSCLVMKRGVRCLALLIPCAVIVYIVVTLEPETNKHIHIPQYVLMAWLLFGAISMDYKGKGIFIIIFMSSSMLGVVDELEQGIHPQRYYGISDMLVNAVSSIIGIFTLMALRKAPGGNWDWVGQLMDFKRFLRLIFFGAVGAILMCTYLFLCKLNMTFWTIYPPWLFSWNCIFLVLGITAIILHLKGLRERPPIYERNSFQYEGQNTARLWVFLLMAILLIMHALVVLTAISGWKFE